MFEAEPSCFGKLPFQLLDELQVERRRERGYWADAITVPSSCSDLTSIDTILVDESNLSRSVAIGILHAINDIFAANGLPSWFSISMTLPLGTDIDMLAQINATIQECAKITGCAVGKLHTSRASVPSSVTTCVAGTSTGISSTVAAEGIVVLVGDSVIDSDPQRLLFDAASVEIAKRRSLARTIAGPKKDVSGDGLAGSLLQLSRREMVSIELTGENLRLLPKIAVPNADIEKNFLDYAAAMGDSCVDEIRSQMFSPRVFGPIVCLAESDTELDTTASVIIGKFKLGGSAVRINDT
jgi:hypothetical protein